MKDKEEQNIQRSTDVIFSSGRSPGLSGVLEIKPGITCVPRSNAVQGKLHGDVQSITHLNDFSHHTVRLGLLFA